MYHNMFTMGTPYRMAHAYLHSEWRKLWGILKLNQVIFGMICNSDMA